MNLSKENFLNKGRQTIENQINNTQSSDQVIFWEVEEVTGNFMKKLV
jgi:hypothetical protein